MDVDDLILLAQSDLWTDRIHAGHELTAHAGEMAVDAALQKLLLDAEDTAVIARTADALLTDGSLSAWKVFAVAWNLATPSQADHLSNSFNRAVFDASLVEERTDSIEHVLTALANDGNEAVKASARQLMTRIATTSPEQF
jgi:hypothetical protein